RRTFATRLLESGADINTVRQAMGHSSVVTTRRYDKRDEHLMEEATRKVAL
uniref:tyrosine-type recombinase/integrase n=1 Tax=Sutterella wadsworthensis TaxID=40545 RepID=UPI0039760F66